MHIDNITLAEPARDWSWDSAAAARQWYHNARANRRLARERREARLAHPEVPEGKPLHEFNVRVVYDGGETSGRCAVIQRPGMLVEWKFKGKAPKGLPRAGKLRRVPTADAYERTVAAVIADGWRERGAVAEVSDRA